MSYTAGSSDSTDLALILDALRQPVVVFDGAGTPVRVNRAAVEAFGFDLSALGVESYLTAVAQLNVESFDGQPIEPSQLASRRALRGETVAPEVCRLTDLAGRSRVYEVTATPVTPNVRPTGAVVVWSDLTERVEAETVLRETLARRAHEQDQLRKLNRTLHAYSQSDQALMRATDEAAYLDEVCRIIVEECRHAMVWVGLAQDDESQTVLPVASAGFEQGYLDTLEITWADTERGRGPTGTAIRTGRTCICRNMLTDPCFAPWREQAVRRGYGSSIALPLSADGRVFGALTIYCKEPDPFSDEEVRLLTRLANDFGYGVQVLRLRAAHARTVEALREADRRKDVFLATLSHELRTPLNAIVGWSQMLLGGNLDAASSRKAIEVIARNAVVQTQIVNDLLDVSRVITGKVTIEPSDVDLADVLDQTIESVRLAAQAKGIDLHVHVVPGLIVSGDASRLQQVFWNLLSNAVKFTPAQGRVTLTLYRDGPQVAVRVSDTGIGIPPAFLASVFDRFSQADSSVSRQHGGLGLGLAIVRHLVELHGGTVRAESAGEGRGAAFTICFPARARHRPAPGAFDGARPTETGAAPVEPDARTGRLAGLRILVVDDEADARQLVKAVLEERKAQVTMAASTGEAMAELQARPFDLLIADIGMPGEDGYVLIRRVREMSGIPAIALSAYGREEDRARTFASGFQQHVTKPVLPEELASAVEAATENALGSPETDAL